MMASWVFWIMQYLKLDGTMGILSYAVLKLDGTMGILSYAVPEA
jgi:hypothetical protein